MGESIVYSIKIALAVACTSAFIIAISALISFLGVLTSSSLLGEFMGLISIYLPFAPATCFATLSAAIVGIIAFIIARKVYEITMNTYKAS